MPTKLANEQRAHIESVQTDTCARARRSELDERCREGTVEALVRPHQFSLPRQRMRANRKWATREAFDRRGAAMGEMSSRSPKLAGGAATLTPGHGVGRGTPRAVLGGQGSRFGNSTYIVAGRRGRCALAPTIYDDPTIAYIQGERDGASIRAGPAKRWRQSAKT